MENLKDLVIINGVTGAIGSAVLAEFACQKNTCIYGLSRKGLYFEKLIENISLPDKTFVCSIKKSTMDETEEKISFSRFLSKIDFEKFKSVTYVHAIGHYPFEVNKDGVVVVQQDFNEDGINDFCLRLFTVFSDSVSSIRHNSPKGFKCKAVLFGGIADKYKLQVHSSWWKSMETTKIWMHFARYLNVDFYILNISSVICPNELISRPFVFTQTDADHNYWLKPVDVAKKVVQIIKKKPSSLLSETSLFKKRPNFSEDYYKDENFTPRKVAELFKKN